MTTPTPSDSPVPGKRLPGRRPPGSGRGSRALLNATLFVTIVGALAMATLARREASIQQNIYTGILQARLEQSALQMQAYVAPAAANLLWLREWLGSGVADLGDSDRLRDLLAPLREKYFISGEINTRVSDMDTVRTRLADLEAKYTGGHSYTLDGFSAEFEDWHFNVRASNTEPMLRLNLEAVTPELMAQKRDDVLAVIRQ
jgi:hypothetical protein